MKRWDVQFNCIIRGFMTVLSIRKRQLMREFNYRILYKKLLTPEVVSYLAQIHEQKGQQNLFIEAHKDILTKPSGDRQDSKHGGVQ